MRSTLISQNLGSVDAFQTVKGISLLLLMSSYKMASGDSVQGGDNCSNPGDANRFAMVSSQLYRYIQLGMGSVVHIGVQPESSLVQG